MADETKGLYKYIAPYPITVLGKSFYRNKQAYLTEKEADEVRNEGGNGCLTRIRMPIKEAPVKTKINAPASSVKKADGMKMVRKDAPKVTKPSPTIVAEKKVEKKVEKKAEEKKK